MKRLMDESEGSTVEGLVVDDGGGSHLPSARRRVSDRRRRRLGRAGSTRSPSSSSTSPPTPGWRSSSSSTSIPRTRASCATRWPRPRPCRSARPRTAPRVEPNHVYVIPPNADISIQRRPLDARAARARRPTVAPVRRLLLPLARRGARQPRDRRRAVGNRLGRHRGPAGHQGGERHHVRAGSGVGEVRRDAAQRDRRRRRRLPRWRSPTSPASWCA